MVLINTIFLQKEWEEMFEEKSTRPMPFFTTKNDNKMVKFDF